MPTLKQLLDSERQLVEPTDATLAKYGITREDWRAIAKAQGSVCVICQRLPPSRRLAIDHEHVPGWKKMPASERRKFVRGLVCFICNGKLVSRYVTIEKARRVVEYLLAYSNRNGG